MLILFVLMLKRKDANAPLLHAPIRCINFYDSTSDYCYSYNLYINDDVITAKYGKNEHTKNAKEYTEMEWSEEKYRAYLKALYNCDVLSWKENYIKDGEVKPEDNKRWDLDITFYSQNIYFGTSALYTAGLFGTEGYSKKPINYDKVMKINEKFFTEENYK